MNTENMDSVWKNAWWWHERVRVMLQLRAHMGRMRVSKWMSLLYSYADPFKMDRWDMGIRDRHGQEQRSFMQKMQLQPCI